MGDKKAVTSFEIKPYCVLTATFSGGRWCSEPPDLEMQSCKITQKALKTTSAQCGSLNSDGTKR